jgi:hypothetical protein
MPKVLTGTYESGEHLDKLSELTLQHEQAQDSIIYNLSLCIYLLI